MGKVEINVSVAVFIYSEADPDAHDPSRWIAVCYSILMNTCSVSPSRFESAVRMDFRTPII